MEDDRRRWDERYADVSSGEPAPPDGLAELLDVVPTTGWALDLACGLGRQAVWAAERGLEVDALDVSPVAIARVRELAERRGVAARVHAEAYDLDTDLDDVEGPYDLVICQRFRDRAVTRRLPSLLAHGGVAVVTVLSRVGLVGEPGPFHAAPGELAEWLDHDDLEVLSSIEGGGEATVVVRRR